MTERTISPRIKRYLAIDLGVGAFTVNLLLNLGLGWLFFRHRDGLPVWGEAGDPSIAGEIIGTCFLLPFFTGLIVTPLAKKMVVAGKLPTLGWRRSDHRLLARLPAGTAARSALIGLAALLLVAVPLLFILGAAGCGWLDYRELLVSKGVFAGLLAVAVTPLIGLAALADAEPND